MPSFYNPELVEWLAADWRVDVIRIPVAVAPSGYLVAPEQETLKAFRMIDAAINAGLYAIVDWHSHAPHTCDALAFFRSVSARYGDCPNVIYETWNEPAAEYSWPEICSHHATVLTAIRENAPNAPAILGTARLSSAIHEAPSNSISLENVAFGVHFYAGTHREGLRQRIDQALDQGIAVFASEWGMGEASGDGVVDEEEAARWLMYLNLREIGHVNWSICDKDEACAALRPGSSPQGRWTAGDLSRSGAFVRSYLRRCSRQT